MALNFLKRKNASRESALLYHNPNVRKQSPYEFASKKAIPETANFPSRTVPKIQHKETSEEGNTFDKLIDIKIKPTQNNEISDYHEENDNHEQNWDSGKERIKKLMIEISDLMDSEDLTNKKFNPMIDSSSDKKTTEPSSITQKRTSKLPLNIEELHSVAAMAKRLSVHSKIKNNSETH